PVRSRARAPLMPPPPSRCDPGCQAPLVDLLSLVLSTSFRTTPVETVRADFPHTACGRALVPAVLGGLRILDVAAHVLAPCCTALAASHAFDARLQPSG